MGAASPDEILVGVLALVLAGLLVRRIVVALRSGEVPLYRQRMSRDEAGEGKFIALLVLNGLGAVALALIGADLLVGLGLKG
jgi:hypothetical protein